MDEITFGGGDVRGLLKACPFCGETQNIKYVLRWKHSANREPFFFIRCENCKAQSGIVWSRFTYQELEERVYQQIKHNSIYQKLGYEHAYLYAMYIEGTVGIAMSKWNMRYQEDETHGTLD